MTELSTAEAAVVARFEAAQFRPLPRDVPLIARLWYRSIHMQNGCYQWVGTLNSDGYGSIRIDGRSCSTHRAAYELTHGEAAEAS